MGWIGITRANDNPFDSRLHKGRGAGPSPALGATWLEGNIDRSAPGRIHAVPAHGILKGLHLGVRLAGRSMPANAHFLPIFYNHRSNRRIRTG